MTAAVVTAMSAAALWPGELTASIEDQRARLPPAPEPSGCADEVSGVWRAHVYYSRLRDWYRYELRIARQGDALTGTIWLRGWTGTAGESEPPRCRPGLRDAEWTEPLAGSVTRGPDGLQLRVDATSWALTRTHCGSPGGDYALDHFSGRVDEARQEFTSTNTYTFGSGETFSDPTLFRRVECARRADVAQAERPQVVVIPPTGASAPPAIPGRRRRFGCAR